jgi:uncharacterized protein (TIGR02145 family)
MLIGRRICKRLSLFLRGRKGLSSALKAQFLFLFTGKYDDGDLKNDLGEGYVPGADDWFLPSVDELTAMYTELHLEGLGGFSGAIYWSSTESNATLARARSFSAGTEGNDNKSSNSRVRACRSFVGTSGDWPLRSTGPTGGLVFAHDSGLVYESALADQSPTGSTWSNITNVAVTGTSTAMGTGAANTAAIIAQDGHTSSAAKLCDDLDTTTVKDVITVTLGENVKYGRIYNYYALTGIAPEGWHVPTATEWNTLATELGGASVAGGKLKEAGTENWNSPNTGATNESGFTALGAGARLDDGSFSFNKTRAFFITSSDDGEGYPYYAALLNTQESINVNAGIISNNYGFSLRLIRDDLTGYEEGERLTDPDGNIYDTVQIGDQVWLKQNYASTKYANGDDIANVTDGAAWAALETGAYCNYDNDESYVFSVDEMWTSKHIPATTRAKFTLPATQAYLDADTDEFWTDGECDVNRLISYDPPRTIVHYDDHPPHNIKKIGILKPGEVLTRAEEDELSRYFRLPWWRFGYFNYFGYWKANMLVDEVREWEAPE